MNELQINDWVLWSLLIPILVGVIGHFFGMTPKNCTITN